MDEGTEPFEDTWLGRAIQSSRDVEERLGRPSELGDLVNRFVALAREVDGRAVAGASRIGDLLAGATASASGGDIRLVVNGRAEGTVLVLDGALNTGVQIGRAMLAARQAGAERAIGGVVVADREALASCRDAFGEIVALETRP